MFVEPALRQGNPAGRNLIVCSDGTGNAGGKTRGTNVWRIYNAVERRGAPVEQIAFYDDGLGTDDWKPLKIAGGAFGLGFTQNLVDLYSFLALNHQPNDRIYLFGFSRGAFTVRTIAGILLKCGLLDRSHFLAAERPEKLVRRIIKAYRAIGATDNQQEGPKLDTLREEFPELEHEVEIEFIGVFDTVDAVGIPFDELRKPIDWISRNCFHRRLYDFRDRILGARVRKGAQALSIDDERKTFHPNVWEPAPGRIDQVWFAGAHSNVGGGYPRDAVSLVALEWMLGHAEAAGIYFVPEALKQQLRSGATQPTSFAQAAVEYDAIERGFGTADVHGKVYNPRKALGIFYRYAPRDLFPRDPALRDLLHAPQIHASVFERIARGTERYAPRVIPPEAGVAYSHSGPYSKPLVKALPALDDSDRQRIRSLTGARTTTYGVFAWLAGFLTIVIAAALFALDIPEAGAGLSWVKVLLPSFAEGIVDLIAALPATFAATALVFVTLIAASSVLRSATQAASFAGWRRALERAGWADPGLSGATSPAASDALAIRARTIVRGLRIATVAAAVAAVVLVAAVDWPPLKSEGTPAVSAGGDR